MPEEKDQSIVESEISAHGPFSFFSRIFFWHRRKKPPEKRQDIRIVHNNVTLPENIPHKYHPHKGYARNRVRTTKYTILSFIPKNLFEQFHRIANLYFIGIVLLNWVPKINAFGKEIAILPVVFVLGVTAIKDWFEDYRRYKSDKRINNLTCRVYSRFLGVGVCRAAESVGKTDDSDSDSYIQKWADSNNADLLVKWTIPIPTPGILTDPTPTFSRKNAPDSDSAALGGVHQLRLRKEGRYVKTLWKEVRVGDVVHLSCNEVIPADILLLKCSDDQGMCYIETANLDGESNLKQREVARGLINSEYSFHPSTFKGRIECDPPNHKIYRFNGSVTFPSGLKVPISKDNLLLKDCVLKNTDFAEGIVVYAGHETKAMLNNDGPRYKRSKLEKLMNREVIFCIVMLILLCFLGALGNSLWLSSFKDMQVIPFLSFYGNEKLVLFREAFLIFWTFVIVLQVMIPLSLYVTIEIIKLGQVYFIHEDAQLYDKVSDKKLECRALNITEELGQVEYVFSDKTGTLTDNNMVFRRCTIGGVDYDHERAINRNANGDQPETAKTPVDSNAKETLIPNSSLQEELSKMEIQLRIDSGATEITHLSSHNQRIQDFFLLLAVCNTVVVAKHPHKDQMNSSGLFLNSVASTPVHVRASGEGWETASGKYSHLLSEASTPNSSTASTPVRRPRNLTLFPPYLRNLAVRSSTPSPLELRPIYEAESPDEIALVETAFSYNCRLLRRTPDSIVVSMPGEGLIEYKILHILPFDATRKRMSIILQHPITGDRILFCKGADSSILPQLSPNTSKATRNMIMRTQQHLNNYSRKGLRVLCMAKKIISNDEYEAWLPFQTEAEFSFEEDKEKKVFQAACMIETDLELLGATGIEDKLQEGVPETISSLRAAGMVVWVLTGDKQETAVNIAFSCKLFSTDMEIITVNARSKEAAEDTLQFYLDQIGKDIVTEPARSGSLISIIIPSKCSFWKFLFGPNPKLLYSRNKSCDRRRRALVIDGRTLAYVLDKPLSELFIKLAQRCTSVLCCRATPLQKAYIVSLVKETGVLTLAIGDGANDVSMIQTADVGVGISGKEGMQAVMASDFSIARFKYLERLLLVHGHWCYDRLARTILYFFYKNANFIFLICWYQWYCGFSANVMIDQVYLMVYNFLFTSLPPISLGIFDKDCPDHLLLKHPSLYGQGRRAEVHTKYSFWVNMLDAIYQSIVAFFVPLMAYYDSDVGIWEFGTTICTACVVGQLLHLAIETRSWTIPHVISLVISFLIFFGFASIYNTWSFLSAGYPGLPNPYWVVIRTMKSATFWFCVVLVPVLGCLPRFVLRSLQGSMFPSDVAKVLYFHKKNSSAVASTVSVTWSRDSSHESSVDLGINGDSRHSIPSEPPAEGSTLTVEDCAINSEYSRL